MLVIYTPYGDRYKVNAKGQIIRMDMDFTPSDGWIFRGISHVKRNAFIPFKDLTPARLKEITFLFKNGRPQWTVEDLDHGTIRRWGNTHYHGIKGMYYE